MRTELEAAQDGYYKSFIGLANSTGGLMFNTGTQLEKDAKQSVKAATHRYANALAAERKRILSHLDDNKKDHNINPVIRKTFDRFMKNYNAEGHIVARGRCKGWDLMHGNDAKYINKGQIEYSVAKDYFNTKGFHFVAWESLSCDPYDKGIFAVKPKE